VTIRAQAPDRADGELDGRGAASRLRAATVGISTSATCGVHDHATLLGDALAARGASSSRHWLSREQRSLRGARAEIGRWTGQLAAELRTDAPDVILLHYSVFSFAHRGVPIFVGGVLSALPADVPVITVLHEFVYPWTHGGWRGKVWAVSQRAALIRVMRATTAAVVTREDHPRWLDSRSWLPARPVSFAPVFSNLPCPDPAARPEGETPLLGVFGYAYQGVAMAPVLDALGELARREMHVRLRLLGAPGRGSSGGEAWLAAARERELEEMLSFSERQPAQELSNELARCNVLLFPDRSGPSARKGTLAAALASGRPIVAIDGPNRWEALTHEGALEVVQPASGALADALEELLRDELAQQALGARGRSFYEANMDVGRTADAVLELLRVTRGRVA
jgi:glycosyltransferase involved in cell wall biosynthesis